MLLDKPLHQPEARTSEPSVKKDVPMQLQQETPTQWRQAQSTEGKTPAQEHENDLPDWLRERPLRSPSSTEVPSRSVQQIEDEIRFAVDSAAARVQHELNRREQFQSDLQAATAFQPDKSLSVANGESEFAVKKEAAVGKNEAERFSNAPDGLQALRFEESQLHETHTSTDPDIATANSEERELLLLMEVVIGDGRTETIEVFEGDNPEMLAAAFVQEYKLEADTVPKLTQLIQDQLVALAETEPEDSTQPALDAFADKTHSSAQDSSIDSSPLPPPASVVAVAGISPETSILAQQEDAPPIRQTLERDNHREFNYNNLMAKYGHYSQYSGAVSPDMIGTRDSALRGSLTMRDIQLAEHTRVAAPLPGRLATSKAAPAFVSTTSTSTSSNLKKKGRLAPPPVFDRLYALAESKTKWIQRAQKAKALEMTREQERMHHVELMAAKSRELIAHRNNGGYAHIGERLHDEALSDLAKKTQLCQRRAAEREQQVDWMCPKCAFVNQYSDSRCQNIVALTKSPTQTNYRAGAPAGSTTGRRETSSSLGSSQIGFLDSHPEVVCGQRKPEQLFRPTLLTNSAGVTKALTANKEKSSRVASMRRQRHQRAMEEEFRQTCPFRPKINDVSEEIVREKLENAATTASIEGEPRRRRDPHRELYEDSFQARASREEREQAYLKQFSFKPDIGVNTLWVASDPSQADFVERLAVDKYHESERKRVALHDKYAPDRDANSGKELFKPETGRAPAFARNQHGLPIGDFLHAAHREQQEYHRRLREKDQRDIKQKAQQGFVSEASRQALEKRKRETCARIFDALLMLSRQSSPLSSLVLPDASNSEVLPPPAASDPSIGDAESSKQDAFFIAGPQQPQHQEHVSDTEPETVIPSRVDLAALPTEISRVVAIVFEFANHTTISRIEFSSYMDRLVREVPGLTYTQVLYLAEHLDDGKRNRRRHHQHQSDPEREAALAAAEQQELTFRPAIDKNSRVIATKHGRAASPKVFLALNQYFDHYRERKEELRKLQQREFDRAHPFQPKLATKAHQRTPAAAAFYDKIRSSSSEEPIVTGALSPASMSSAPASYRYSGAASAPPAPLQTAITHARPYVRPIESYRSRFYTATAEEEDQLTETLGLGSRSSSSSQLLEDAELTSRVLAALDDNPATVPLSSTSPFVDLETTVHVGKSISSSGTAGKVWAARAPEEASVAPSPMLFDLVGM
ncbi:hypothetical protein BBJ28_00002623 [Nothophytophthora sp. Chile5]|nr:hypothetical protein BBJ28_00002623 [Nothophytophthora sp. Chile5]